MRPHRVALIAQVECWAGSRGDERPLALVVGGRRIGVVDILERTLATSAEAGEPITARFLVVLEDDTTVELERAMPDGEWRCWRIDG